MKVELVLDTRSKLGECPVWCSQTSSLYWIDAVRLAKIYRWTPGQSERDIKSWSFDHHISAIALSKKGGLIVAAGQNLCRFNPSNEQHSCDVILRPFAVVGLDNPSSCMNDGACDPQGRFWVGTMQSIIDDECQILPLESHCGELYRVTAAGNVTSFDGGFGCPNTVVWSPDGRHMYFGDSLTGWIYRYKFDSETGTVGKREEFARHDDGGMPDGSAVDVDGFVWNARFGSGSIVRFDPTGRVDCEVKLPVSNVTSCAFGGNNLTTLYITTSQFGLAAEKLLEEPHAGGLFSLEVGVSGLQSSLFG